MNYLTPAAWQRMKRELTELLDGERPRVVAQVSAAAALGDRSENADYIYGKRRLREIDRRIRFLSKRLEDVEVVDPLRVNTASVVFGAWVRIREESGVTEWYQIVGQDEISPHEGKITFSSPLGRAMLGKKVGDTVEYAKPGPILCEIEILEIRASLNRPTT